jgi:hypothetical protein
MAKCFKYTQPIVLLQRQLAYGLYLGVLLVYLWGCASTSIYNANSFDNWKFAILQGNYNVAGRMSEGDFLTFQEELVILNGEHGGLHSIEHYGRILPPPPNSNLPSNVQLRFTWKDGTSQCIIVQEAGGRVLILDDSKTFTDCISFGVE